MMAILQERREYLSDTFTSADRSLAMAIGSKIVSESGSQFISVDSSIVKGPIRLQDPVAKIWPPCTNS